MLRAPNERATTIVTYEEQVRGWLAFLGRAKTIDAYGKLHRNLDEYRTTQVLAFDARAAIEFDRLRSIRSKVGVKDLQIAAIVVSHHAVLLSRNVRDFRPLLGNAVEDWTFPVSDSDAEKDDTNATEAEEQ